MPSFAEKTDAQWHSELASAQDTEPLAYQVTRHAHTEPPFTGKYLDHWLSGQYACVCCGAPLFSAGTKFDAGCGWPSFSQAIPGAITEVADFSHHMQRIETICSQCAAHLGHVFPDGPQPLGLRYCINSAALRFVKDPDTTPAQP